MERCFLINVPWIFSVLWHALQPMMSAQTVAKVIVLDANYREKLGYYIPEGQLPSILGGAVDPESATVEMRETMLFAGTFAKSVVVRCPPGSDILEDGRGHELVVAGGDGDRSPPPTPSFSGSCNSDSDADYPSAKEEAVPAFASSQVKLLASDRKRWVRPCQHRRIITDFHSYCR
jgi:hypothetical protein